MSYNSLTNYYKMSSILKMDFNYSLDEQNNILPYEREIIIAMIMDRKNKEEQMSSGNREEIFDPQNRANM